MAGKITAISSDDSDNTIVEINAEWYVLADLIDKSSPEDAQDYQNQVHLILDRARLVLQNKPVKRPEADSSPGGDPRRARPL